MADNSYSDTVYGQILPLEYDKRGVSRVMILVDGDEEFVVMPTRQGAELVNHVDSWVRAKGVISEENDEVTIKIYHYDIEDEEIEYTSYDDRW